MVGIDEAQFFEHEIVADFVPDMPWHHYEGVTSLSDDDKKKLAALVRAAAAEIGAPGRRGFWWVKWVVAVEVSDRPPWRQPPFPLR